MEHTLPPLPYALDALAPHMSRETLEYHHDKHHQAYVTQLNVLIKDTQYAALSLEDIVKKAPAGSLFNNAAQAWNHAFFWKSMRPKLNGNSLPTAALATAIHNKWGSHEGFNNAFKAHAVGQFGSGWTWLVKTPEGSLSIVGTSDAGTPLTGNDKPLLVLDVWEHAYYIDYRNKRAAYVDTFLSHLINWEFAEKNFA
jgi:superoxide dismutase, Fe-Mn family